MFIQLAEDVNPRETCALRPQGVIRICAVEARNLLKKDVKQFRNYMFVLKKSFAHDIIIHINHY